MHPQVMFGKQKVRVVNQDGSSFVLENKPGILEKLKMENELECVDRFIERADDDFFYFQQERNFDILRLLAATAVDTTCIGMSILGFLGCTSDDLITANVVGAIGAVNAIAACGLSAGVFTFLSEMITDSRKKTKAATISVALEKYKQELLKNICDNSNNSYRLITGKKYELIADDYMALLQRDLGISTLYVNWYAPGNLGTWSFRRKYGVTKLEVYSHTIELFMEQRRSYKKKQKRLV